MKRIFITFIFLFVPIGFLQSAHAAYPARVDVDETPLYQFPKEDAEVLKTLRQGEALAISNYPTQGYYKARTIDGDVGWVKADVLIIYERGEASAEGQPQVRVQDDQIDGKAQPRDPRGPRVDPRVEEAPRASARVYRWQLRALVGMDFFPMTAINDQLGDAYMTNAVHGGGEGMYRIVDAAWVVLRAEYLFKTVVAKSGGNQFEFYASSLPVYAGIELNVLEGENLSLGLGLLGGLGLGTSFSSTASGQNKPNVTEYSGTALSALVRGIASWHLTSWLNLFAEAGYRYLATTAASPTKSGNGNGIFVTAGKEAKLSVDMSGLDVSAGVGLRF